MRKAERQCTLEQQRRRYKKNKVVRRTDRLSKVDGERERGRYKENTVWRERERPADKFRREKRIKE